MTLRYLSLMIFFVGGLLWPVLSTEASDQDVRFNLGQTEVRTIKSGVRVSWALNRPLRPGETVELEIRDKTNRLQKTVSLPSDKSRGTVDASGRYRVGDHFFLSLVREHGGRQDITLTAQGAGEPSPSASPGAPPPGPPSPPGGGERQFSDTLFGFGRPVTAGQYLYNLYIWAVAIAIIAATISIIRAGYVYTMGRGNPSAISSAKEMIVSALVGLALLILSYTILRFVLGSRVSEQVNYPNLTALVLTA